MKNSLLFLSFLLLPVILNAQSTPAKERSRENALDEIPSVLGFSEVGAFGLGALSLKDEATSPLIYNGPAFSLAINRLKRNTLKESQFGTRCIYGLPFTRVGEETDVGQFYSLAVNYTYLRNIPKFSFANTNVLVGGTLDVTSVIRVNTSFLNNAFGLDFFPTLMGSVKLNKPFYRKSIWHQILDSPLFRWIGSKKQRPKVHQEVSFQTDIGFINTNLRNGFAYTSHAPFYNNNNILEDHQFHWFSGLKIRSSISYLLFSNNTKNGTKFSYIWEGFRSGTNPDRFSVSSGMFQFSLIHRLY